MSNVHLQAIAEARPLDLEVLVDEIELVLERHHLRADAIERQPQQVAEPRQHRVGGVDVAVHQRRDRVERVEQEVRVQLPLQRLQLRFGQAGLQLRGGERALLRLAVVVEGVAHRDDGPVGHHLPVEVEEEPLADAEPPLHFAPGQPAA